MKNAHRLSDDVIDDHVIRVDDELSRGRDTAEPTDQRAVGEQRNASREAQVERRGGATVMVLDIGEDGSAVCSGGARPDDPQNAWPCSV